MSFSVIVSRHRLEQWTIGGMNRRTHRPSHAGYFERVSLDSTILLYSILNILTDYVVRSLGDHRIVVRMVTSALNKNVGLNSPFGKLWFLLHQSFQPCFIPHRQFHIEVPWNCN